MASLARTRGRLLSLSFEARLTRESLAFLPFLIAALLGLQPLGAAEKPAPRKPKPTDAAAHSYPALGAASERKVRVEWNQFYDHAGLGAILAQLHRAFPKLTRLYSLGKSVEGRELWCLEVSAFNQGDAARKPGMWIDGNIHGNEVQGAEVVAYTAWYLCHQYGRLEQVTELLDRRVFYLTPTINPDGRDRWLHRAQNPSTSRSGLRPDDDDGDGTADEDDCDDLDGDGSITMMRIKDPHGHWKPHPLFPDSLMVEVGPEEPGEFTLLGLEGLDNDGDGQVNEDPAGGYDMNRNWAWDWQPEYVQRGALEYPFCLPETRAVADFIVKHPNIAAAQSYHNFGGMILRSPGREGGAMHGGDERLLQLIAQRGEKMLPYYRSMLLWKDLYTVWGGEIDWLYGARGIVTFTTELWSLRNLDKTNAPPSREDEAAFLKYVLLNDGVVTWHPFHHPLYGPIEIGGTRKEWGRTPVSFLLEEECHRNMAFTLYHADQMPRLRLSELNTGALADGLYRVEVTVENDRLIPTRLGQDIAHRITPPDIVSLSGRDVTVVSAGRVTDRFRKRIEAVRRRPERLEIDTVPGRGIVRVQFLVSGHGEFQVTVDSARGGLLVEKGRLPGRGD